MTAMPSHLALWALGGDLSGASIGKRPVLGARPTKDAGQGQQRRKGCLPPRGVAAWVRGNGSSESMPSDGRSCFAGAADKAGTRENQVSWEWLFSGGGGKATG